jgi:dTMP kinase
MKARFITFEGIEGSGKSTVAARVKDALTGAGIETVLTREPGGTELSERVRRILLDPSMDGMDARTELLLYLASRAQLVEEVIRPALERGTSVLCDRFMDASVAYQGWARGIGESVVEELNAFAVGGTVPDRTFLLDLPVDAGFERGPDRREGEGTRSKDRLEMEARSFHAKVREGYLRLALRNPDRIVTVDASASLESVSADILRNLRSLFGVEYL